MKAPMAWRSMLQTRPRPRKPSIWKSPVFATDATSVVKGNRDLALDARQTVKLAATDLFGAFSTVPMPSASVHPSHDVTVARLVSADGILMAEAFHFRSVAPKRYTRSGFEHS